MLHCFGLLFFFQFILFFFFLPNYCNSTTCKTNALSPYHESVRSQRPGCRDGERGPQGKKPPPGRRGAGRRLEGGGSSLLSPSPRPGDARGEAFWSLPRLVAPSILGCCGPEQGVVVPLFWQALGPASHRGSLVPKPNPRNQIRGAGLGLGGVMSAFLVAFCSLGLVDGLLPPPGAGLLAAPRGAAGAPSPPPSAGLGGQPLPAHPRSSGLKESVNLSAPNTSVRNQSSRNLNQKVLLGDPFQYSTEENWKKETCCLHGPRARACLLQLVPVPGGISASLCLSGSLLPALALPPRAGKMGPKS